MATTDILLPTCNRLASLVMTLGGVIEERGGAVEWHHRPPLLGIAEQGVFLIHQATAETVLYLDDDVLMEPWVLERLLATLRDQACGFVGAFPAGLSHRHDRRPEQQKIDYWEGPVLPEVVEPESAEWARWPLHLAANLYHVAQSLPPGTWRRYKVAWVASCILYDRRKLEAVGGFSFWQRLPRFHSGEEVLVQNLLMRRWGGCGMVPSGTYYSQVPTTVLNDRGSVDGHALDLLPEMVQRYASPLGAQLVASRAAGSTRFSEA